MTTEQRQRTIARLEYLTYIRDSYPQTCYFLAQWNALYERYRCTICHDAWERLVAASGGECDDENGVDESSARQNRSANTIRNEATSRMRGLTIDRLTRILQPAGRYLACVNFTISRRSRAARETAIDTETDDDSGSIRNNVEGDCHVEAADHYDIHICNFLPLVVGSSVDIRLRYGDRFGTLVDRVPRPFWWTVESFLQHDLSHFGQTFLFGRWWVFSSFIHTDSRQCHRYRKHTNHCNSVIRMYVYDKTGKGNMIYLTGDGTLHLRDKFRREVTLFTADGRAHAALNVVCEAQPEQRERNERSIADRVDHGSSSLSSSSDELAAVDVIRAFYRDVAPMIAGNSLSPLEFFHCCHEYIKRGIGATDSERSSSTSSPSSASSSSSVAVASAKSVENETPIFRIPNTTSEIDHINNKRVSNAPALYSALLEELHRALHDSTEIDDNAVVVSFAPLSEMCESRRLRERGRRWKICVAQYTAMSQRANLLPFISRRTHIRRDWCELMKRQMKNEMRIKRTPTGTLGTMVTSAAGVNVNVGLNGGYGIGGGTDNSGDAIIVANLANSPIGRGTVFYKYRAIDVSQDNVKIEQQFLCAKIHTDVEYDHELVKRMRVVNLNAMTCLKMPLGFARFFSYFNVGNISNAGRVMNKTHSMRESFISDVASSTKRVIGWLNYNIPRDSECVIGVSSMTTNAANESTTNNGFAANGVIFAINEMPVLRRELTLLSFDRYLGVDAVTPRSLRGILYFWWIFRELKYLEPGLVITVTQLMPSRALKTKMSAHRDNGGYFVNIRLMNGIPMCPVILEDRFVDESSSVRDDDSSARLAENSIDGSSFNIAAASYCHDCSTYYAHDALRMSFAVAPRNETFGGDSARRSTAQFQRLTALPRCRRHAWCSRHELTLYELSTTASSARTVDDSAEVRPKLHELACHGLLSVAAYPYATDVSKLIVAINAHKRALELRHGDGHGDDLSSAMDARAPSISTMQKYLNLCADRTWRTFDQNGKITRLYLATEPSSSSRGNHDDNSSTGSSFVATTTEPSPPTRLIPRNAVRLLFAFGDFNMMNCEDGYVLSDRLRLLADTTFCRKISFSCKSRVSFLAQMTLEYTHDLGVRVHVGTFSSFDSPVRFFNVCGNARVYERTRRGGSSATISRHHGPTYAYELYLTWNASFVQRAFDECGVIKAATVRRDVETCASIDNYDDCCGGSTIDSSLSTSNASVAAVQAILLRETRTYEKPPISESTLELRARCVRVTLRVHGVRQTLKLQNSFGQKGIAHYADLSDLRTDRGEPVDLISSMYSLLGRFACGQLMEQQHEGSRYIVSRRTGMCVGAGGYGYFFVSNDFSHNNFIYSVKHSGENPMRLCKLTYDSFLENSLSSSALVKASEFESGVTNPYAGIPRNVVRALNCYGLYGRDVCLKSQSLLNFRRREHDKLILRAIEDSITTTAVRRKRKLRDRGDSAVHNVGIIATIAASVDNTGNGVSSLKLTPGKRAKLRTRETNE